MKRFTEVAFDAILEGDLLLLLLHSLRVVGYKSGYFSTTIMIANYPCMLSKLTFVLCIVNFVNIYISKSSKYSIQIEFDHPKLNAKLLKPFNANLVEPKNILYI